MQGKALTVPATVAVVLVLAACGGGGGDEASTSTPTAQGVGESAGVEQLHRRAEEVRRQRRRDTAPEEQGQGDDSQESSAGSGRPAEVEARERHDSGGGVAQFRKKGHDNSIQDLGEEASGAQREEAASTLHAYLDARAEGRWADACSYLAADAVAVIERFAASYGDGKKPQSCPYVLEMLTSAEGPALEQAAEADVGALRQEGDRGFLLYHGAGGLDYAIPVVEEEGDWKLSAPEPSPLP